MGKKSRKANASSKSKAAKKSNTEQAASIQSVPSNPSAPDGTHEPPLTSPGSEQMTLELSSSQSLELSTDANAKISEVVDSLISVKRSTSEEVPANMESGNIHTLSSHSETGMDKATGEDSKAEEVLMTESDTIRDRRKSDSKMAHIAKDNDVDIDLPIDEERTNPPDLVGDGDATPHPLSVSDKDSNESEHERLRSSSSFDKAVDNIPKDKRRSVVEMIQFLEKQRCKSTNDEEQTEEKFLLKERSEKPISTDNQELQEESETVPAKVSNESETTTVSPVPVVESNDHEKEVHDTQTPATGMSDETEIADVKGEVRTKSSTSYLESLTAPLERASTLSDRNSTLERMSGLERKGVPEPSQSTRTFHSQRHRQSKEGIRLAEMGKWDILVSRLTEQPDLASHQDQHGMMPLHWACLETEAPLPAVKALVAAYPQAVLMRNRAQLLPLHIALKARTTAAVLAILCHARPSCVLERTPAGQNAAELAREQEMPGDCLAVLHRAEQKYLNDASSTDDEPVSSEDDMPGPNRIEESMREIERQSQLLRQSMSFMSSRTKEHESRKGSGAQSIHMEQHEEEEEEQSEDMNMPILDYEPASPSVHNDNGTTDGSESERAGRKPGKSVTSEGKLSFSRQPPLSHTNTTTSDKGDTVMLGDSFLAGGAGGSPALCNVCYKKFSVFRTKHQCKGCHMYLCRKHVAGKMMVPGFTKKQSVCGDCFRRFHLDPMGEVPAPQFNRPNAHSSRSLLGKSSSASSLLGRDAQSTQRSTTFNGESTRSEGPSSAPKAEQKEDIAPNELSSMSFHPKSFQGRAERSNSTQTVLGRGSATMGPQFTSRMSASQLQTQRRQKSSIDHKLIDVSSVTKADSTSDTTSFVPAMPSTSDTVTPASNGPLNRPRSSTSSTKSRPTLKMTIAPPTSGKSEHAEVERNTSDTTLSYGESERYSSELVASLQQRINELEEKNAELRKRADDQQSQYAQAMMLLSQTVTRVAELELRIPADGNKESFYGSGQPTERESEVERKFADYPTAFG